MQKRSRTRVMEMKWHPGEFASGPEMMQWVEAQLSNPANIRKINKKSS
jgi:hypothetical protein